MSYKKNNRELIIYPAINKDSDFFELITKLSWYVPLRDNLKIVFITKSNYIEKKGIYKIKSPYWMNKININLKNITIKKLNFLGRITLFYKFMNSFFYKFFRINNEVIIVKWDTKNISFIYSLLKKFFIERGIDNKISSYKSDLNLFEIGNLYSQKESLQIIEKSKKIFKKFVGDLIKKNKKSYIFTRGRSVELCIRKDLDDGIKIVTNSLVASNTLMRHIKPQFIVAVDHAWYFGASNLSQVFLNDVFKYISNNHCLFIVPSNVQWLLNIHYPKFKNKIIGIPYNAKNYNLNLLKEFSIFGSVGVLHEILIPLATSLSDEIIIYGADGKYKNDEEKIFPSSFDFSKEASYPKALVKEFLESRPGYYELTKKSDFEFKFDFHLKKIISIAINDGKKIKLAAKSSHPAFNNLEIIK